MSKESREIKIHILIVFLLMSKESKVLYICDVTDSMVCMSKDLRE